ncbi:MAG: hypothetical protein RTV72_12235 [Candidatus Thorarchaeota archaeon]
MLDDGYVVYPWDSTGKEHCQLMKSLNLISVFVKDLVDCINPLDSDYKSLSTDQKRCTGHLILDEVSIARGWKQCTNCGRPIYLDKKEHKTQAWLIRHKPGNIAKYVEHLISAHVDIISETGDGISWDISKGSFSGLVALLEYLPLEVTHRMISERASGFLGIVIGNNLFRSIKESHNAWNFVPLVSIFQNPDLLESVIIGSMTQIPEISQIENCRKKLENRVSTMNHTGTEFEAFCHEFESNILGKPERVHNMLASLLVNRKYAYRSIRLGGPGLPDLIRLPLYRYISEFLTSVASIEVKQYVKSSLTVEKFGKALVHSRRYPDRKMIVYVSSTNIAPSIWNDLLSIREPDGGFQYFIMDSLFIAYLMIGMGLEYLIE